MIDAMQQGPWHDKQVRLVAAMIRRHRQTSKGRTEPFLQIDGDGLVGQARSVGAEESLVIPHVDPGLGTRKGQIDGTRVGGDAVGENDQADAFYACSNLGDALKHGKGIGCRFYLLLKTSRSQFHEVNRLPDGSLYIASR